MKIIGIDLSFIVVAITTAYIGYQFNLRSKKKDIFLKEISNSYNEVYFPMYELLSEINRVEEQTKKLELIVIFFDRFSGINSSARYIGSSKLLEKFFETRNMYFNYKINYSESNEHILLESIENFRKKIVKEFWDAHDIIYDEYLQLKADAFRNPFIVLTFNVLRGLYHLTTFSFIISLFLVYFTVWDTFTSERVFPEWWTIRYAIGTVFLILTIYGLMNSIKEIVIIKNRRKSKVLNKIRDRVLKWIRR